MGDEERIPTPGRHPHRHKQAHLLNQAQGLRFGLAVVDDQVAT
ncbi:MAG: hypothetical protein AB1791_18555 [Chloroflexota bacterium]